MRVLALGASGEYGKHAAKILASSNLVSEIIIAGRNLESAQKCAKEIGEKAKAVSVDISDHERLISLAGEADIIVNTAGPEFEVTLKTLRAAITAGTNYCDISADGPTIEQALGLDSAAKANDVTALLGIGMFPGLTNLLMMHAISQLDSADEVRSCFFLSASVLEDTNERLRQYRGTGLVGAAWQMIMKWPTPPFNIYRGGALTKVGSKAEEMKIAMPGNGDIPAVLVGSTETITMPRAVPELRDVHAFISWFPFQLNHHYAELGQKVNEGRMDLSKAALAFLDSIKIEFDRKQAVLPEYLGEFAIWAEAIGKKNGRSTRYSCWPASGWASTGTPLAVASLKILGGEIEKHGILAPESCLDPLPFFNEVARRVLKTDEPGKILNESWTN